MNLSKKLKDAREISGYSQAEIAEKLHISRQAISRWENDKAYPDIDNLIILSNLYQISLDELLLDQKEKSPQNAQNNISSKNLSYEQFLIVVVTLIACIVPVIGLLINISAIIFCVLKKIKLGSIGWFIICACLTINIANAYAVLSVEFFNFGKANIEKISFLPSKTQSILF